MNVWVEITSTVEAPDAAESTGRRTFCHSGELTLGKDDVNQLVLPRSRQSEIEIGDGAASAAFFIVIGHRPNPLGGGGLS